MANLTKDQCRDATASRDHCEYCFDVLINAFTGEAVGKPPFPQAFCPLFVAWLKNMSMNSRDGHGDQRGCIGSLEPRWLHTALGDFAIRSGFKDQRYNPIEEDEVPFLSCEVSLLKNFQPIDNMEDWVIGDHGLSIKFLDPLDKCYRSSTFLPYVAKESLWSHSETIDQLIRKAGYKGVITTELRSSLEITSYEVTTFSMTYDEYIQSRSHQAQNHATVNNQILQNGYSKHAVSHNGIQ